MNASEITPQWHVVKWNGEVTERVSNAISRDLAFKVCNTLNKTVVAPSKYVVITTYQLKCIHKAEAIARQNDK